MKSIEEYNETPFFENDNLLLKHTHKYFNTPINQNN